MRLEITIELQSFDLVEQAINLEGAIVSFVNELEVRGIQKRVKAQYKLENTLIDRFVGPAHHYES